MSRIRMNSAARPTELTKKQRSSWQRVFKSNDPFANPFQETIESRMLMYPTYGFHLDEEQFRALMLTMNDIEVDRFFISVVEHSGDFLSDGEHWLCSYPTYRQYLSIPLVLENTMLAEDGSFGLMISHEDHALVGGTFDFIDCLKARYARWRKDQSLMVSEWDEDVSGPIISSLVK